jgi:peroxiredoxin Q/BCP
VSVDTLASHANWIARLKIPFLLLSDPERKAGKTLELMRRIKIGSWGIEFFRRSTLLVDKQGVIAAAWGKVQIRGHARQVLQTARVLQGLD